MSICIAGVLYANARSGVIRKAEEESVSLNIADHRKKKKTLQLARVSTGRRRSKPERFFISYFCSSKASRLCIAYTAS